MAENLFDFDPQPALRAGPDLREMRRIDFAKFIEELAAADVVCCVSPDDSFVVLPPGETVMRAAPDRAKLNYFVVQVANDSQADMLAGARQALAEGGLSSTGAGALRDLLTSVADVPDSIH